MSNATASITAPADNFLAAMRLAVEFLKEPHILRTNLNGSRRSGRNRWRFLSPNRTSWRTNALPGYLSPFAKNGTQNSPTREEQLAEIRKTTLDEAKRFHDQFYGANFGIFAVVGPVTPADMQKAAVDLLGSWNTARRYKRMITPFKKVTAINEKIETPDKANAQFLAAQRFQMSQDDPDYPAIVLASYMFGEPITSHIPDRIRNREGLSYGANARITAPAEGDAATLTGP